MSLQTAAKIKRKGATMNNSTMGNLLRKYTKGAPHKVWKVATECPGCLGCIFYVSERKKAELGEFAYKCNRRNLTLHGYSLNELFVPMNFEDWRCGVSQFRFAPLREKKPSAEEEERLARRAAKKEARRVRNEAIIDLHLRGLANYEICARLKTSKTTVSVVIKEYNETKKQ